MMKTRISAFLLALVFVLLCLPIPVVAETEEESEWKPILPSQQSFATLKEGDLTHSRLQTLSSENVALPETISVSDAIEKELVNRLYAQETD